MAAGAAGPVSEVNLESSTMTVTFSYGHANSGCWRATHEEIEFLSSERSRPGYLHERDIGV